MIDNKRKKGCKGLLILVSLSLLFFNIFFSLTFIPSNSMVPTYNSGDLLLMKKVSNPTKMIQAGNIYIFKHDDILMIKRLIGLPGDKVFINSDGDVFVNDILVDETYLLEAPLAGESMVFQIPDNALFFLGDNRNNSIDSRYWKQSFVPVKDIIGIPVIRLYALGDS